MAVEDLDSCVKQILCTLADSALRGIQVLIDGQIVLIQVQIVAFQQQILQYDIIVLPVQASQVVAQAIADKVRNSAALIPLNIISGCTDLGFFNTNLQQSIDIVLKTADDFLFEAARIVSFREELNLLVVELNNIIEQFTDISTIIDQCLAGDF